MGSGLELDSFGVEMLFVWCLLRCGVSLDATFVSIANAPGVPVAGVSARGQYTRDHGLPHALEVALLIWSNAQTWIDV